MAGAIGRLTAALLLGFVALSSAYAKPASVADPLYIVDGYYPAHDVRTDLATAVTRATAENKRILLVVGGDWCVWCEILDRFVSANADVHAALAESFVILKVNTSREKSNEQFLSNYPTPNGYPDFIILESDGAYLGSQNTELLEQGRTYNRRRMIAFANRWRKP